MDVTLRREAFLEHVRERGEYDSLPEAERAARVVLALLGAHLAGEVRAELAARLPEDFALILLNATPQRCGTRRSACPMAAEHHCPPGNGLHGTFLANRIR